MTDKTQNSVPTVYQVVIIGTGFGGQAAAINLKQRGYTDFIMLERRAFAGGTWLQNRYPGAAVDVQSPLYSLSAMPYKWTQMFVTQPELAQYTQQVFNTFNLTPHVHLEHEVTNSHWDTQRQLWCLNIIGSDPIYSKYIINATGPLSMPVIPNFPGKETFTGVNFHTNNWPDDLDLTDKRVAIVGSGASAAQVIPAIVDEVKSLAVFQRSPHWIIPRPDMTFAAWMQWLLGVKWIYNTLRSAIYWGLETRVVGFKYSQTILNLFAGGPAKRQLQRQVSDPVLRKALTPDFTIGCKRIILSNTFYPAICREHVTLFDKNNGIKTITENGIITADGTALDLDVIIYSTGYDATDGLISYPVIGRHNTTLASVWDDYPRAYLGTSVPDFPNYFIVTGPNTGIGHTSAIFVIEAQMHYIMQAIDTVEAQHKQSIEPTVQAESKYTDMVHREMEQTVWQTGGCNSWYKSASGKVIAMFPGFSFIYKRMCQRFKLDDHIIK
ncbi:MAG: flavin-containing monooxygenase [Glaciecola sp.]|jgi:cation diffusion facilitator CzcD-associated flavoprotein CzcO